MTRVGPVIAALVLLAGSSPAGARVGVTFPLGEHYRVGKYFPARVVTNNNDVVHLVAPGALRVQVGGGSAPVDAVVPLLAIETVERDDWPLRPLAEDQRLIGTTVTPADAELAAALFPGRRVVSVPLDISNPLPGPAMAWEALDAIVLDAPSAARVTQGQLATLLAAGTAVAVRADARPGGGWPWRRQGAWWVARADVLPAGGVVRPDWYAQQPPQLAGRSPRLRHITLLALAAFSLAALGVTLWRSKRAWVVNVVLCAVAAGGIAWWWSRQPAVIARVATERAGAATDRWTHYAAAADGAIGHYCDAQAMNWPILFSGGHARQLLLHLICDTRGEPVAFGGRLRGGQGIAFLSRSVEPASLPTPVTPTPPAATSPAAPPR